MRAVRLVMLAVVVLALASYIYFVERHAPTTDEVKQRADKVFPTLDQSKVQRVIVTNSHGRFELANEKGDWKLKAPLADDANQAAVTSLLGSLTSLKSERTLDAKDIKLADYGLEQPGLHVQAVTEDGIAFQLTLGAEMPLGSSRAALTSADKVLLVNKYIASDLEKDLSGWRSDQLVRIYSNDVAAVNLTYSGVRVALAHTGTTWSLTEPVADLADRERADGLINDLGAARIKEFVDQPQSLGALGLEPRRFDITLLRRGENAPPILLEFGDEREVGGSRLVACKRADRVFWVEASAVSKLTAQPTEWRARKLVQLDTWSADSLELEAGPAKVALERKEGQWHAGPTEVEFSTVSSRLNILANLQVQAFDQPRPAAAALGKLKVAVSGGTTIEATFFPGTTGSQTLAVVPGRPGALAVESAQVNDLLADPAALARPRPTAVPSPMPSPAK